MSAYSPERSTPRGSQGNHSFSTTDSMNCSSGLAFDSNCSTFVNHHNYYGWEDDLERTTSLPDPQNLDSAVRPTPSGLKWPDNFKILESYEFEVAKGKYPCFRLRPEYPTTSLTPRIVFLDGGEGTAKYHPCQFPGESCWKGQSRPVYYRPADLERHYRQVHASEDQKEKYPCDRFDCNRAKDPFTRKDHFRDHLKDFHKEDIGSCKGEKTTGNVSERKKWQQKQAMWLAERCISSDWWRCARCLVRVYVAKGGWYCQKCKRDCEQPRREAREKLSMGPQSTSNQQYPSVDTGVDQANESYSYQDNGYSTGYNTRSPW